MDARVRALGYVVLEVADLPAWRAFGVDLLGLMPAVDTSDRLTLRMDEYVYRLDLRAADADRAVAVGYEVADSASLAALRARLIEAGYEVTVASEEQCAERRVDEMVRFRDPDGIFDVELYCGLHNATEAFTSSTGARFMTRVNGQTLGVGHVQQIVSNPEVYRHLYLDLLGFRLSDYINDKANQSTFLHCNPRHHTFAFAARPSRPLGIGHLMFEVDDLDTVGRAYDRVLAGAAPIFTTLGRHTNDKMISMYIGSPSGFGVEYGTGGVHIDDDVWTPTRYHDTKYWGHERVHEWVKTEKVAAP